MWSAHRERNFSHDLVSIEIHKRPWKACGTIKPKAPDSHEALEKDDLDIIYVLVSTVIESNKKMEEHFNLWKFISDTAGVLLNSLKVCEL
jgi:hypothetical protein